MLPALSPPRSHVLQAGAGEDLTWPEQAVPGRGEAESRGARAQQSSSGADSKRKAGARWGGPFGDQSWAFSAPLRPQAGPCWLRLSSSALHTHMDTTVAFPSLNCTMNGWPCGEEEQAVTGDPQTALHHTRQGLFSAQILPLLPNSPVREGGQR